MTELAMSQERYRRGIPYWVNQIRGKRDLVRVTRNPKLHQLAYERARDLDLAPDDYFAHADMSKVLRVPGTIWAGECLAAVPDGLHPREIVGLWMHSEGHRRIILALRATDIGIGAVWDESRRCWIISLLHADGSL